MIDSARILLVEDDAELAEEVTRALKRQNIGLDHVSTLADACEAVLQYSYRTILLDRSLPDGDGIALVPIAKLRPSQPSIIFLTGRDEINDRIEGLDAGADDYVVKPFALGELLARLRAANRKAVPVHPPQPIEVGRLTFDTVTLEARVAEKVLTIPRRELTLLHLLVRRTGKVVQRHYLESEIYGFGAEVTGNALEALVSRLRRRLEEARADIKLQTIRGVGYMLKPC